MESLRPLYRRPDVLQDGPVRPRFPRSTLLGSPLLSPNSRDLFFEDDDDEACVFLEAALELSPRNISSYAGSSSASSSEPWSSCLTSLAISSTSDSSPDRRFWRPDPPGSSQGKQNLMPSCSLKFVVKAGWPSALTYYDHDKAKQYVMSINTNLVHLSLNKPEVSGDYPQ